jgi:hypothetical protein
MTELLGVLNVAVEDDPILVHSEWLGDFHVHLPVAQVSCAPCGRGYPLVGVNIEDGKIWVNTMQSCVDSRPVFVVADWNRRV